MSTEDKQPNNTGSMIAIGGLVIIVVAIAWWIYVYILGMEVPVSDAIECLAYTSDGCAVANGLVAWSGHNPYNPAVLWAGGAVWLVGMVVKGSNS